MDIYVLNIAYFRYVENISEQNSLPMSSYSNVGK